MVGHGALDPDEQVVDACWGMGRGAVKTGDTLTNISPVVLVSKALGGKGPLKRLDETTSSDGMGARIGDHNGMLVLTDRRMLWMEVKSAIGKPQSISAEFGLDEVEDVTYEKGVLSVRFSDGSQGGIQAAPLDKPAEFVTSWRTVRESRGGAASGRTAPSTA